MAKQRPAPPPLMVPTQSVEQAIRGAYPGASRNPGLQMPPPRGYGLGTGPVGLGPQPDAVHQPGGDLLNGIKHPAFITVERLYRKLPEEGMFIGVTPQRPFSFELGSFMVPDGQSLWLMDYEFGVLRQSGIDAGDFVYAEAGRFSGQLGFDITVSLLQRQGDLAIELDPTPNAVQRETFRRPPPQVPWQQLGVAATEEQFTTSVFESYASTAGPGNSLLPTRPTVYGPRSQPFTLVVSSGQKVSLSCVVFKSLTATIAAIEGRFGGYMIHASVAEALLERMRPR